MIDSTFPTLTSMRVLYASVVMGVANNEDFGKHMSEIHRIPRTEALRVRQTLETRNWLYRPPRSRQIMTLTTVGRDELRALSSLPQRPIELSEEDQADFTEFFRSIPLSLIDIGRAAALSDDAETERLWGNGDVEDPLPLLKKLDRYAIIKPTWNVDNHEFPPPGIQATLLPHAKTPIAATLSEMHSLLNEIALVPVIEVPTGRTVSI